MSEYCKRLECDFSSDGKFCEMLDNAGVPKENRWRTLILYMRGLQDYTYLTDIQKSQVQNLLVEVLQDRDFSDEKFKEVLLRDKEILVAPYEQKLKNSLHETVQLAEQFKSLMLKRKGDVQNLEVQSVQAVESGQDTEQIVATLKATFREVIRMMEKDAQNFDYLTRTDPLTGIYNRRAFDEHIRAAIADWQNSGMPLALVMLDIDHFKLFNDEFGHRIGDQALKTVANIMRKSIESFSFEGEGMFPARYGGEEFAIVLSGPAALIADELARDVRMRTERYNFVIRDSGGDILRKGIGITISAGVAEADTHWDGAIIDHLIDASDKALYFAKNNGRNRVAKFSNLDKQALSTGSCCIISGAR